MCCGRSMPGWRSAGRCSPPSSELGLIEPVAVEITARAMTARYALPDSPCDRARSGWPRSTAQRLPAAAPRRLPARRLPGRRLARQCPPADRAEEPQAAGGPAMTMVARRTRSIAGIAPDADSVRRADRRAAAGRSSRAWRATGRWCAEGCESPEAAIAYLKSFDAGQPVVGYHRPARDRAAASSTMTT